MNIQYSYKEEQIFESTLILIQEFGFHGTPMSQIAKKANVAIGTIYHYFQSKDELVINLFLYCKQKVNTFIFDPALDNLPIEKDYRQKFTIVWKRFISFYLTNKGIFSFIEQFHSSPYYEEFKDSHYFEDPQDSPLLKFLDDGIHSGKLKNVDPQVMYTACLGSIVFLIRNSLYANIEFKDEQINILIDIIWDGVKI